MKLRNTALAIGGLALAYLGAANVAALAQKNLFGLALCTGVFIGGALFGRFGLTS
jgi:hypothetical protein